ncbi:hypothetical protein [Clostridium sp.]
MLIFSLIMAFSLNAKLALIFLIAIPFLGYGIYITIINAHPIFERVFRTYERLNNVVQENFIKQQSSMGKTNGFIKEKMLMKLWCLRKAES